MTLESTGAVTIPGTLAVTGAITGASYSGGAISGSKVTSTGELIATGGNSAHAASKVVLFQNAASQSILNAYGADASTYGSFIIRLVKSDGTSIDSVSIDSTAGLSISNPLNIVSPTSPNRTITMVVGGTTVYIAAKTTND